MSNTNMRYDIHYCDAHQPEFFDITLSSGYSYFPLFPSIEIINELECHIDHFDETDISELLMSDKDFFLSIKRAREQMRKGTSYFSHNDIFGG